MQAEGYETVLLTVKECFIYNLPPRVKSEGYKAGEWGTENFLWQGRLRIISQGDSCWIRLEDGNSGELFASCPYTSQNCVEPVLDSSRYFVIRVEDQGRHAFLGLGFQDRSEAFDFNVALQDFLKHKDQANVKNKQKEPEQIIDYSLKEGETINLSLGGKFKKKEKAPTSSNDEASFSSLLPPPPHGGATNADRKKRLSANLSDFNINSSEFGDFESANSTGGESASNDNVPTGWAKFD
ncbi:DUF1681-domain-containing protein [Conidiobolus coronatus NRRL 28638]|uniref:DUF1681-domain-containing protein n=1 Tax=Conidiobolus coronatus (strain ATCC 28846 / CBS 209.66 / NRRL 28638) TaxID=796925 RepID=A0A137PHF8_CONC2|nr:DUF1681-domain-containing protein [Conidiobolus coronatus NRRL 28638]|eukprot:KXN74433.1 DUF1681-domain-containing protein [Conidiobolus coronatus NRRL 28638]